MRTLNLVRLRPESAAAPLLDLGMFHPVESGFGQELASKPFE
jgi:hypothetical protein